MKRIGSFISYIFAPIIFITLALFIVSASSSFYLWEFDKNGTYEVVDLPEQVIPEVVSHIGRYLIGLEDDFNHQVEINGQMNTVYGEREVLHMADVRTIYDVLKYISLVGVALCALMFLVHHREGSAIRYLSKWSLASQMGIALIILFLGVLILFDFSSAFVTFHHIFFDNDLWILNPKTDRLIQMLPEVFFRDAATLIVLLSLILASLFRVLMVIVKRIRKSNYV